MTNNGSTTSFAYDAAGIRVMTTAPNGTVTDYPFPGYEVENPTGSPTVRITFSIAGQAVALKVMGSSTNSYYLYNDHLGSTATMSTAGGGTVAGSTARYTPFGNWRTEPTANLTDRGFTGHMHNNLGSAPDDIGLIYMNARWFSPVLGRFISADTIVPDPMNPQSLNRYSYTRNSPLNFADPTGHRECRSLEDCGVPLPAKSEPPTPIWERSPVEDPDWVQFYGFTKFSEKNPYNTNGGQHSGLDYGKYAQLFGGTWNNKTEQWDFDGTYGTTKEHPLIPVYAGCNCTVDSISTGNPYAPGRVNLTHGDYPDFLLMYGHLQDIQVTSGTVTPDTIIGYLDTTERHLHLEIRRISDNHFVNPFPYLSQSLQVEMRSFRGDSSGTTYQPGHSANPAQQPPGYYK